LEGRALDSRHRRSERRAVLPDQQAWVDQYGHPAIVNAIGSMDVDFIIDEGPDTINMQADAAATLQALGPQFAQQFPDLAIELSPLETRVKSMMLKKIQAKQNQPPPPDPKDCSSGAGQATESRGWRAQVAEDNSLEWRKAMLIADLDRGRAHQRQDRSG
jgi:hypothetical protein